MGVRLPVALSLIYHRGVSAQVKFAKLVMVIATGGLLSLSADRPSGSGPEPAWHGKWIEASKMNAEGARMDECMSAACNSMPLFRKEFKVDGSVTRALLLVSGLGQYEFRINGVKVGDRELTPGWSD